MSSAYRPAPPPAEALPYVGAREAEAAATLIEALGPGAAEAAAIEADRARDRGNVIDFCRWRQVERLIVLLGGDPPAGPLH